MESNFHDDIEKLFEAVPYGNFSFSVTTHNKQPTRVEAVIGKSIKFSSNNEAGAAYIQFLKDATDSKFSGVISVSVTLNDGEVTRIVKSDNTDFTYQLQKGDEERH